MNTLDTRPDTFDRAAGLEPTSPIFELRALRPEFIQGGHACQASVLTPKDDLGLSPDLRATIARRVAKTLGNSTLIAEYPLPSGAKLQAMSEGKSPTDKQLSVIANYADEIALAPGQVTKAHLENLLSAGLETPQIIALSELLAFVCFQAQVAHGLSLLGPEE